MKKIKVAIMGLGTVGGGTYDVLTRNRDVIKSGYGVDVEVAKILDKSPKRLADKGAPEKLFASNIDEIVSDPEISIVVETMGGLEPAGSFIIKALESGKSVVTANKELLSKRLDALLSAADKGGAGLYIEASCVGGVPIIRTLTESMQANRVTELTGIINGTTNYILTKMSEDGAGYADALGQAQKLGYAEFDPTADVEGFDAAYKLSILSSLAFHTKVPFAKVFREGITEITKQDIADGKELGYRLKLLAIGKQSNSGIEVRVHPTFVPEVHPLAAVNDSFNAVFLKGDSVGDIMLYGRGAGALPTGSAIVSDIIYAATHTENRYSTFKNTANADKDVTFISDFRSAFYLRVSASDKSGVLSKICAVLAKFNVSIEKMAQRDEGDGKATLTFVTHETRELAVRNAIARVNALGFAQVQSVLRVVS